MMSKQFHKKTVQHKSRLAPLIWSILGLLILVPGLSGCKKFLDVEPQDKVPQSVLFNDEQGFKDAMNGVYLSLDKPKTGGTYGLYTNNLMMGMVSILGYSYDNAATANAGGEFYKAVAQYAYADARVKPEIDGIWAGMYSTIANINNLLGQIDGKKSVFSGDNYYRVKGEAIGARALLHFDLLRLFGPSPAVGATQKAIPYVRNFGIRPTSFSTINEALDSCIRDLHEAKALLAQTDTTVRIYTGDPYAAYTQNHVNYWTVEALLSRVHLYRGNTDSARHYAMAVIGSNKFPLISSNVALSTNSVRDRLFSQEVLFSVYSRNIKTVNSSLFENTGQGITPLLLTAAKKTALYTTGSGSASDYRYLSWFDNISSGVNVPSKFFQNDTLPYHLQNNAPVVRVSEMYYIAAECANAKGDIGTGVSLLNKVRQSRGLAALNAGGISSADSVSKEIMKEYQKEFIQEGQTFFYYKRLNKDLKTVTSTTVLVPADAYVFPIPDKEKEYNR